MWNTNVVLQIIWFILWVISFVSAVRLADRYYWHCRLGPDLTSIWVPNKTRSAVLVLKIIVHALILLSPLFLESIAYKEGYAVFDAHGKLRNVVDGDHGIITQAKWNRLTRGGIVCPLTNYRSESPKYMRARINCQVNKPANERSDIWCYVALTGVDTTTNLIKRAAIGYRLPASDDGMFIRVAKHVLTTSPYFMVVEDAVNRAHAEGREITVAEKADMYERIAPLDKELWEEYGIRIVDISVDTGNTWLR